MVRNGYSITGPPVEKIKGMEWLPIADAARIHNCSGTAIIRQIKVGTLPAKKMPRPAWRDTGHKNITYVHTSSIHPSLNARWNAKEQRYKPLPKPRTKLGSFFRSKRWAKGWTLKRAARAIGAPHNSLSDWELGKRAPTIRRAWMLCELYDLTQAERVAVFEALAWSAGAEVDGDN